ncbi:MAG: hypothetical protein U0X93_14085 [Anaerolineales bacterium]
MTAEETLAQIAKGGDRLRELRSHHTRKKSVPARIPATAEIMFIGEVSAVENEQGRPFVGAGGEVSRSTVSAGGVTRADVWIGNVVKSPPAR